MRKTARLSLLAASGFALLAAPATASAQALPAGLTSASLAKTDAILGGAPSALAAIIARQSGMAQPAPVQPAALAPASYRLTPTPAVLRTEQPLFVPAVVNGRPDVFGTVALAVGKTKLDSRWRRVERSPIGGAAASYAASLRNLDGLARADAVNRYVNGRVQFVDDWRQYGRADMWSAASDTLRRGKGDCEDYAIAKMQMLRAAGIANRDMYLVILKDLVRRSDHAVLVVRTGGRMLLLDNGTDVINDTETVRDYRPVLTFSAAGTWTHGYRRTIAPFNVASAVTAASTAALAPSAL
ncbi:MAG TPA: transglutaminase-like cysteine peptidase [Sphingomicrobium sp.]|nr:transglutaminase-like cysteine peptidase [Sphingomicrobium sp.]